MQTTKNLTSPIFSKLLFLYIVFYIYANIGQKIFGGKIYRDIVYTSSPGSPPFYYLLNFNSFGASLVTLFHFMVINNWFLTIDMYHTVLDARFYPMLFFVCFWCMVTLILLNVIIALMIEIYTSVEPEVSHEAKKMDLV